MLYYVSMDIYDFSGKPDDLKMIPKEDGMGEKSLGLDVDMAYWNKKEDELVGYFEGDDVDMAKLKALKEFKRQLECTIETFKIAKDNVERGIERIWKDMGMEGGRILIAKKCKADFVPYVGEYVVWEEENGWWFGIGEGNRLARDLNFKVGIREEEAEELGRRYEEFVGYLKEKH